MQHFDRVLIVEDDPDAAASLADVLGLEGFHVTSSSSIQGALEELATSHFGVIVTDRRLPDGLIEDRLPEMLALSPDAEVIVVTGYSDLKAAIDAFRRGVSDYIIKPIIAEDLLQTVRRVVERRRLLQRVQQESDFSERMQSTAEAIILVLDRRGTVIRINRFFELLTGWRADDLIGKSWFEQCVFSEDESWLRGVFQDAVDGSCQRGVTTPVRCQDGSAKQVRWSHSVLALDESSERYLLSVGIDVSDLMEASERAIRSERLAAIGETVTALAHESRNAIQRIQAAADVLCIGVQNADDAEELAAIQRATTDLSTLLESVRAYAAPIQAKREETDLADVWRRAWLDLKKQREGCDARLIESVSDCDHQANVDVARMEQVFRNLFCNSIDAAKGKVQITVDCDCSEDFLNLTVADDGPGLKGEQFKHLFDPFFTTKSTGTGLGLPICQRIIEAHGGSICAEDVGQGAMFRIQIPRDGSGQVKQWSSDG